MNIGKSINNIVLVCLIIIFDFVSISKTLGATVNSNDHAIQIIGEIDAKAYNDVKSLIELKPHTKIEIDSEGGSIGPAMQIGRLLRKYEIPISITKKCLSSCFLIFIGSPERYTTWETEALCISVGCRGDKFDQKKIRNSNNTILSQYKFDAVVGYHRPYFSSSNPNSKINGSDAKLMFQEVEKYFDEMNIPKNVFDDMMKVVPEDMKYYFDGSIYSIIPKIDPIQDEKNVRMEAITYGIGSKEVRQRRVQAAAICQFSDEEILFLKKNNRQEIFNYCDEAIMWNIDLWAIKSKKEKVKSDCGKNIFTTEESEKLKILPPSELYEDLTFKKFIDCQKNIMKQ